MYEIIKCVNCGSKMEFIKAIRGGWTITPFSYTCPQCIKNLKIRVNSWINGEENKKGIKKMKEQDKKWNEKCQYLRGLNKNV